MTKKEAKDTADYYLGLIEAIAVLVPDMCLEDKMKFSQRQERYSKLHDVFLEEYLKEDGLIQMGVTVEEEKEDEQRIHNEILNFN